MGVSFVHISYKARYATSSRTMKSKTVSKLHVMVANVLCGTARMTASRFTPHYALFMHSTWLPDMIHAADRRTCMIMEAGGSRNQINSIGTNLNSQAPVLGCDATV